MTISEPSTCGRAHRSCTSEELRPGRPGGRQCTHCAGARSGDRGTSRQGMHQLSPETTTITNNHDNERRAAPGRGSSEVPPGSA